MKFSATCEHEGTKSGTASVVVAFAPLKGFEHESFIEQDIAVSVSVKNEKSKSFSVLIGVRGYCGLQLHERSSVEPCVIYESLSSSSPRR